MAGILIATVLFVGDAPPPKVAAYLKERDKQLQAEIERLTDQIALTKKTVKNAWKSMPDPRFEAREKHLEAMAMHRNRLQNGTVDFVPQIVRPLVRGAIGRLDRPVLTVRRIVDDRNMIVDATYVDVYKLFEGKTPEDGARSGTRTSTVRLWLRGVPTGKLANGAKTTIDVPVEVTGSREFNDRSGKTAQAKGSGDGSSSLLVIEPADMSQIEPFLPGGKMESNASESNANRP